MKSAHKTVCPVVLGPLLSPIMEETMGEDRETVSKTVMIAWMTMMMMIPVSFATSAWRDII